MPHAGVSFETSKGTDESLKPANAGDSWLIDKGGEFAHKTFADRPYAERITIVNLEIGRLYDDKEFTDEMNTVLSTINVLASASKTHPEESDYLNLFASTLSIYSKDELGLDQVVPKDFKNGLILNSTAELCRLYQDLTQEEKETIPDHMRKFAESQKEVLFDYLKDGIADKLGYKIPEELIASSVLEVRKYPGSNNKKVSLILYKRTAETAGPQNSAFIDIGYVIPDVPDYSINETFWYGNVDFTHVPDQKKPEEKERIRILLGKGRTPEDRMLLENPQIYYLGIDHDSDPHEDFIVSLGPNHEIRSVQIPATDVDLSDLNIENEVSKGTAGSIQIKLGTLDDSRKGEVLKRMQTAFDKVGFDGNYILNTVIFTPPEAILGKAHDASKLKTLNIVKEII